MSIAEAEARRLVIEAGHRLQAEGLIARTWGNISARISKTQFVITPSGLAYDTLREEQLVIVNIEDGSYTGSIRPSSELGVHADCYRLRPAVDFVIHTHQFYASCVGLAGTALKIAPHPLLGSRIPCAQYGAPSSMALRRAVENALLDVPDCPAVLMRRHGALCAGRDSEEAFAVAQALEAVSQEAYENAVSSAWVIGVPDLGTSVRENDAFVLMLGEKTHRFPIDPLPADAPDAAKLHAAIYQSTDARCILQEKSAQTVAASCAAKTLRTRIDDLAMIAGTTVRCSEATPQAIKRAVKDRHGVLVRGAGALCFGIDRDDAEAVGMILKKCCAAERYADAVPNCTALPAREAAYLRRFYLEQYSKRKV